MWSLKNGHKNVLLVIICTKLAVKKFEEIKQWPGFMRDTIPIWEGIQFSRFANFFTQPDFMMIKSIIIRLNKIGKSPLLVSKREDLASDCKQVIIIIIIIIIILTIRIILIILIIAMFKDQRLGVGSFSSWVWERCFDNRGLNQFSFCQKYFKFRFFKSRLWQHSVEN